MEPLLNTFANTEQAKPTQEEIAAAAFHLFLEHGCVDGHDVDHWLRAETMLTLKLAEAAQAQSAQPAPGAARSAPEIQRAPVEQQGSNSRDSIPQTNTRQQSRSRTGRAPAIRQAA